LDEVADAYFGTIPDIFRRPNIALYEWVARAVREAAVRGVLLIVHPWCDLWRAEIPRLRETARVPLLPVDPASCAPATRAPTICAALENRLRAFAEITA
jgi:benzoyl-CoA reductase/2-hydroxyglutaryl-CoA dehydratase subunit BcrC/BadD/HgdB